MRSLVALLTLTISTLSFAFGLSSPFQSEPEFLPVEQAFNASVSQDENGQVWVSWDIEEGYYLYQHQLSISSDQTALEFVNLPEGELKQDPYFGDVKVYHDHLRVPVTAGSLKTTQVIDFTLQYQGCAEKGLCYPPQRLPMSTQFTPQNELTIAPQTTPAVSASSAQNVSNAIAQSNLMDALLLMFGLGLLLSLTPCVLPMVPIVSAIVVGSKAKGWSGFYLSAVYVLGMALTYAIIGALAAWFGAQLNLQAALQNPIILGLSAALFGVLALAMFGVFELRLPSRWQAKLDSSAHTSQSARSRTLGVFFAGIVATLVVSPCVSAPLAGVVLYISTSSDPAYGAATLFVMGLGMGVPLLLVGALGSKALPKNGPWLEDIKTVMGFGLLALSLWLAARWLTGAYELLLWGAWLIALGGYFLHRCVNGLSHPIRWFVAAMALILGAIELIGGVAGGQQPLSPLSPFTGTHSTSVTQKTVPYYATITSLEALNSVLEQTQKPVVLDLYADWCISCKVTEEEVFKHPEILPLLGDVAFVQVDVTDNSPQNQALLDHFGLFGPPAMLFFDDQHQLIETYSLVGEPTHNEVLERLQAVLQKAPTTQSLPQVNK